MKNEKHSNSTGLHEDFSREEKEKVGTERQFGLVFAAVSAIVGAVLYWTGSAYWTVALATSIGFLVVALWIPNLLRWPNRFWLGFGALLHKVMQPIILGILFYGTITPIAILLRIAGKDPLNLKFCTKAETYWITRKKDLAHSMSNQF